MYILHIPSWFPDDKNPYSGNFIEKHISAIARFCTSVTLKVVFNDECKRDKTIEKRENETIITYFIQRRKSFAGKVFAKLYRDYLYEKAIKEIQQEFGIPKLIHLHVAYPRGNFAKRLSQRWKIPMILTEHWTIYQPQNRDKLTRKLHKKIATVYSSVSAYTAVSKNLQLCIANLFSGITSTVIPNVVDTEKFYPVQTTNQKKVIVHISTLDKDAKNFPGILHAVNELSKKRDDFTLKVIHENRSEEAEQYVQENNLSKFVSFLGSKTEDEVAKELQQSDFLLLFSNYENLPCVIVESFASGKPVVVTPVGGIAEIVDETRGIFVTPSNELELVQKLNYMLDNYQEYDSQLLRQFAEDNFATDRVGKQFFDFYKAVLQ